MPDVQPVAIGDPGSPARFAVVADDAPFTRSMVSALLTQLGFDVTAVGSANDCIDAVEQLDPDLVVVDLDFGDGPSGLDAIRVLREEMPWVAVLVLTAFRTPKLVDSKAPELTGISYLVKADIDSADVLAHAVEAALSDESLTVQRSAAPPRGAGVTITPGQSDVLRLMADGLSNPEIADRLSMSLTSVERIIGRLYRALGIVADPARNSRVEAVRMYRESGIDAVARRTSPPE